MLLYKLTIFIIGIFMVSSCGEVYHDIKFPPNRQIAHRGFWRAGATENSVLAVQYAINANLYGAEVDVYETIDGVIIVNHDANCNGFNLSTSLYYDIDSKCDVPTLEDFLSILRNNANFKLVIEIKFVHDVMSILRLIDKYQIHDQIEFLSFNRLFCEAIIQANPKYRVGYLGDDLTPQYLYDNGYDIINSSYNVYLRNPEIIRESQNLGLDVYTWTVNDAKIMSLMYDMGVQLITTDLPRI